MGRNYRVDWLAPRSSNSWLTGQALINLSMTDVYDDRDLARRRAQHREAVASTPGAAGVGLWQDRRTMAGALSAPYHRGKKSAGTETEPYVTYSISWLGVNLYYVRDCLGRVRLAGTMCFSEPRSSSDLIAGQIPNLDRDVRVPRRALLGMLMAALLVAPRPAPAQQPGRVYRLGVLSPIFVRPPTGGPDSQRDTFLALTLQDLRDRGYIERKTLMVEHRSAEGHVERLPELAAELVRLHVDVILAEAAPAIHAALTATTTIPIVMITGDDPVRSGFVASLGRPGGNITGVTILARDLAVKRLEFLDGPRLLPLSTAHRSLANGIRLEGNGGGGGAHSLRAELLEPGGTSRDLHRSDPQGHETRRPAGRGANPIPAGCQHEG